MNTTILHKVVELAGGQAGLAAGIRKQIPGSKVSQAHVWKWLNRAKCPVPPGDYVIAISRAIEHQVTPHELRPDIYPHPHDGLPENLRESVEQQ